MFGHFTTLYMKGLIYMTWRLVKTRKPWRNYLYTSLIYETVAFNPIESAEIINEFQIGWVFDLLGRPIAATVENKKRINK